MSKKSLFRRPFKKWHRKRAEISLEAERQHVYDIDSSLQTEFGLKKAPWVIHKILALFVNPLTADNKFFLLNRGNLFQHFQIHLSHKWKIFVPFFFFFFLLFVNLDLILNISKKKMTFIADVFLNLRTPKNVLR